MPRKGKRDYAAEYKRRIARALDRGYSRAVARGHARPTEIPIKRAKKLGIIAGSQIVRRASEQRPGYRPTRREIIERIRRLGLPLSEAIIRAKWKGPMRNQWAGAFGHRYLKPSQTREDFVDFYTDYGLSSREAYTLWFSP